MAIVIGSNRFSLPVLRQLDNSSLQLARTFERLSSGQRINRASDDAAGLAVASGLNLSSRVFAQGIRNLNDGISALSIADGATAQLAAIVTRQRELAAQSANGVFTDAQRQALNTEAQSLAAEYQRTISTTTFNGLHLLQGATANFSLQAGFGEKAVIHSQILDPGTGSTQQIDETVNMETIVNFWASMGVPIGVSPDGPMQFLVADLNNNGIDDLVVLRVYRDALSNSGILAVGVFLGQEDGAGYSLHSSQTVNFPTLDDIIPGSQLYTLSANIGPTGDIRLRLRSDGTEDCDPMDFGCLGSVTDTRTGYIPVAGNGSLGAFVNGAFAGGNQVTANSINFDFTGNGITDQVSISGGDNIAIQTTMQDITEIEGQAAQSLQQGVFSLATMQDALEALDMLKDMLDTINDARSRIGALQSRVGTAISVLDVSRENFIAAESRIRDVDVASETAELTRYSILQEISAAILAQANLVPQIALSLLGVNNNNILDNRN